MNEQEIRIAVAEACGWKHEKYIDMGQPCKDFWMKEGRCFYLCDLPDYPNDLNAMHEAEKVLTREQLVDYCNFRLRYTTREGCIEDYKMICATARQRCEAFLRTVGRYVDNNA